MDPRAFIKISIASLGVKVPQAPKAGRTGIHSSTSPFFCEIRLPTFPVETLPVPLVSSTSEAAGAPPDRSSTVAATFYLDESALDRILVPKSCFSIRGSGGSSSSSRPSLEVFVYTGTQGKGKLLGTFSLPVSPQWLECKPSVLHNGWTSIGATESSKNSVELHLNIRIEADPRYIFRFEGDTVNSPQIVQIQGSLKQPLFSCKFNRDRSRLGEALRSSSTSCGKWSGPLGALGSSADKERKERKGWMIMIHDLSGSPVAAASMATPFVPTAGTDRVSRSNPGAWLILKPDSDSWEPWGRLEAWRERGKRGGLGLRFQLVEGGGNVLVAESVITSHGGEFSIDTNRFRSSSSSSSSSSTPVQSPQSSGDCNFNLAPSTGGFVMSCTTKGKSRGKCSGGSLVQLAMRHITCAEDAAVFIALAAAVDLSIDACQPFGRKLRKELS